MTAHDGFTLHDLVSYIERHNEANGENGRGRPSAQLELELRARGTTTMPRSLALRKRQMRNLLATLFLSQGVPMLQAGDEFARTQRGNNNAYCQDNEISWVDWSLLRRESRTWSISCGLLRKLAAQSRRVPPRDVPEGRRLAGRR